MSWKDKVKKAAKKVEKGVRDVRDDVVAVPKKIVKEADRVIDRLEGKVDAEVGRAKAKYDPSIAIAGIAEFNTDELARRLKILAMRSTSDAIIITLDWFEECTRASTSKLDDFLLPLLPMIRIQVRKLTDRIK